MEPIHVRLTKDRPSQMVPVDQIVVVHSRGREKKQFEENVRSIDKLGLYKGITVNKRNFGKLEKYELICGEGRLMAHRQLGKPAIKAYVIDVDDSIAILMTLGENIARIPPNSIDYARAIQKMHDDGEGFERLALITGKSEEYLRKYVKLMQQGEERLIKGVEDGIFPLVFALNVAQSGDRSMQHLLMDAFDNGIIGTTNLARVRRIIDDRLEKGRALGSAKKTESPYTVDKLRHDIRQVTRQKEGFVYEGRQTENRLFRVLMALQQLRAEPHFVALLQTEKLDSQPTLMGKYVL